MNGSTSSVIEILLSLNNRGGSVCQRETLTARLTAGIPGPQEWGDQATGARVILGTTEEEVLIFAAIQTSPHPTPPPASRRLTAPSVNLHNLN